MSRQVESISTDDSRSSNSDQTEPHHQNQNVPSSQPPANNRSILILREIERDSAESAVRDLFNSENCPSKPVHCEYALQNSWYVAFKSDEDAKLALAYIRKYTATWKGQPIMARYKPKPAVPSATSQPPPHALPTMVMQPVRLDNGDLPTSSGAPTTSTIIDNGATTAAITNATSGPELSQVSRSGPVQGQPVVGPPTYQPPNTMLQLGPHHMMHAPPPPPPHPHQQHHAHHPMAPPQHYGYPHVAYYGQQNPSLSSWHYANGHYANDISEVFIYNGLTPYPSGVKSGNPKLTAGAVSGASLLGGQQQQPHQQQQHQTQQHQPHHNHHQHHHQQHHHTINHRHHYHQSNPSNQHMYGPPSSNGIKSSSHQGRNKNSKHK